MTKRFRRGLVVGKFAPLHLGHESVIRCGLEECDELVIISYSQPEFSGCEPHKRQEWLTSLFPSARIVVVTNDWLRQVTSKSNAFTEVPANSAEDYLHRRFCAFLCEEVLGVTIDAVFSSEEYGNGFAAELSRSFAIEDSIRVQHCLVDLERQHFPISGTVLRADIHAGRRWLSPEVYRSFVRRICFLGGESSGKTTLVRILAGEFETQFVPEYGRELWEAKKGQLDFEDLVAIARRQVELEDRAAGISNRFLFCDTSPLTTRFYSKYLFGRVDPELERLSIRSYDAVMLCAPDFPFVQDGTRQPESFRTLQHEWYVRELTTLQIPFYLLEGDITARVATVKRLAQDFELPQELETI